MNEEKIREKLSEALQFLFPFVVIFLIWEAVSQFGVINPSLLPAPSQILTEFWVMLFENRTLQSHLYRSFYRVIIGFFLGATGGIGVGLVLGTNKTLRQMFSPILKLLISIPTIAWVPALLITVGIGDTTIIIAIFLAAFFPSTYNTMDGLRGVDGQVVRAARISGAGESDVLTKVLLPGAMSSIIPGLRLAVGYSWRALVGAEMLAAASAGVGYMVYAARAFHAVKVMFVGLAIIGFAGLIVDRVFMSWLERKTIERWGMATRR